MDGEERQSYAMSQAWVVQGWVTSWKEGTGVERDSRVKWAWAWAVQGWVTSCVGRSTGVRQTSFNVLKKER